MTDRQFAWHHFYIRAYICVPTQRETSSIVLEAQASRFEASKSRGSTTTNTTTTTTARANRGRLIDRTSGSSQPGARMLATNLSYNFQKCSLKTQLGFNDIDTCLEYEQLF
ncbi:hypothetical protein M0804_012635 [Polistes exclamans]|nr:hypothetical protein M0804_012635 [Polistes exclamans]